MGWEIDIDPVTARRYLSDPSPLGDRLRAAITFDGDTYSFALTEEERCPFLDKDDLCDIIKARGEDALCDVCALHPRFFETVHDIELCGLGLSCEAVCTLLTDAPALRFVSDTGQAFDFAALLDLLGCKTVTDFRFTPRPGAAYYAEILTLMAKTEPIDDAWTQRLGQLSNMVQNIAASAKAYAQTYDRALFDRIYQYITYRQIENLDAYGMNAVLTYGRLCTEFIFLQDAIAPATAAHMRRFSEQIEYSTENVDILMQKITPDR